MMDWGWGDHMSSWGWLWMGFWSVLVVLGLMALVILAMRALDDGRRSDDSREDPLEILNRRYAAGELDDADYDKRRGVLSRGK